MEIVSPNLTGKCLNLIPHNSNINYVKFLFYLIYAAQFVIIGKTSDSTFEVKANKKILHKRKSENFIYTFTFVNLIDVMAQFIF